MTDVQVIIATIHFLCIFFFLMRIYKKLSRIENKINKRKDVNNNEQVQKQRCEYIEQIHALPTRLFMYNPKTDEYIELKP